MDGDVADLPAIVEVCRRHGARLLVDEAHSTFVYGANGRGVAEHFGLDDEVDIHLGTFSKSLGGLGGFVAARREFTVYLKGFATRPDLFLRAAAGRRGRVAQGPGDRQERAGTAGTGCGPTRATCTDFCAMRGVDVGDSNSQVISIMIRDDPNIFEIAEDLLHAGVYLNPVRYPAVGKHKSRFRMSISAAHTRADLEEGVEIITSVLKKHGKCP